METIYDLVIIGGGPAGCAAGVYAGRKKLHTVLITESFGGQSIVSETIYNWIGTPAISGSDLAKNLENHVRQYPDDVEIITGTRVSLIAKNPDGLFMVTTTNSNIITARAILITTGSSRKQLNIPGADIFEHRGLTYCASCDGPVFSGQSVAVIGGGNAGFESALQLLAYCSHVTLIHRNNDFRADPITIQSALAHKNFTAIVNAQTTKITGNQFVDGLEYTITGSDEIHRLDVSGIFVEIGHVPNTDFVASLASRTATNAIEIDPTTGRTSCNGIWAAGDCTNVKYFQNNIAAGDAVRALEDLYVWVKQNKK